MPVRRIGQILVDLGFIDDDQLESLVDEQRRREEQLQRTGQVRGRDHLIGKIAIDIGLLTDEQLAQALAEQMGMQSVSNLAERQLDPEVLAKVDEPMARVVLLRHFAGLSALGGGDEGGGE